MQSTTIMSDTNVRAKNVKHKSSLKLECISLFIDAQRTLRHFVLYVSCVFSQFGFEHTHTN